MIDSDEGKMVLLLFFFFFDKEDGKNYVRRSL